MALTVEQGALPALLLARGFSYHLSMRFTPDHFLLPQHRCEYSASSILSAPLLLGAAYYGSAGFTQP